ncbi:unnamed protein product [Adineta steineri]|uniref:DUF4139 domain-containing protein n=1 Tax=Adineta steineri TaxID=433720 RepID=A0A814ZGU6_9BILA|nr:unnamed protein product [Adineta steineri]CAF3785874.1 unnamed protein product [Adineta steineri]
MKSNLFLFVFIGLIVTSNCLLSSLRKPSKGNVSDFHILANVKIYSNLAEIIQPLSNLPLEFTEQDWRDIRPDSLTLVGTNVNITQQTITEKKKSLNNAQVYVRTPSSSETKTEFIKATLVDESRNLVKVIDKDISKDPIYFTAQSSHIVYESNPPETKYYVNFTYDTTDAVHVSYLRSNLNWKTRYQLNLLEDTKPATLISMADIRNDGQSKVEIEHAELLGGDINLQMQQSSHWKHQPQVSYAAAYADSNARGGPPGASPPTIAQAEEIAGLYVFAINEPFSIDAKTNYLLPMFRPRVTVERYNSISKYFHGAGAATGQAQRTYRIASDRFLSGGNCIVREYDRLAGETTLPNLAAKNKHEFSLGEDADIVYRENVTVVSTRTYNETSRRGSFTVDSHVRTESVYTVTVTLKNYKKTRAVKVEYEQKVYGQSVKLVVPNPSFKQEGTAIKTTVTLAADEEKVLTYKFEQIS